MPNHNAVNQDTVHAVCSLLCDGVQQSTIAVRCGVSAATVTRIKTGQSHSSISALYDLGEHQAAPIAPTFGKGAQLACLGGDFSEYWISSDGRLFSTKNRHHALIEVEGHVGEVYRVTHLWSGGVSHKFYFHRVVCETFNGPCPPNKREVAHRNGDPLDNRAENLYWATKKENAEDARKHGTMCRGSDHPGAKLTEADVAQVKRRLSAGENPYHIAQDFPVAPKTIYKIQDGGTWKHVKG